MQEVDRRIRILCHEISNSGTGKGNCCIETVICVFLSVIYVGYDWKERTTFASNK